jgi:hypothetical protein
VGRVVAGQEHDAETAAHFAKARLILLLVSADYLNAKWAEMKKALARHEAGETRVIRSSSRLVIGSSLRFPSCRHSPAAGSQ